MVLTEKEKKHIEEEEAYRAKLREEAQHGKQTTPKPKKGISGCLVVFLVFSALIAIILLAINPAKQFETANKNAQITPVLEINSGSFTTPSGERRDSHANALERITEFYGLP